MTTEGTLTNAFEVYLPSVQCMRLAAIISDHTHHQPITTRGQQNIQGNTHFITERIINAQRATCKTLILKIQ